MDSRSYLGWMSESPSTGAEHGFGEGETGQADDSSEPRFLVVCWDDPVNLMAYVTHVFTRVFGWSNERAERHTLQVREEGRSPLTRGSLERVEFYLHRLQHYGLQATMERESR